MAEFTATYSVTCPSCGDGQVIKKGQRNGSQRFGCKACGKKFRLDKAEGRKFSEEQMGIAVRLYYNGVSYQQLAETFRDLYDIKLPSKRTFYRWVSEYTDKASYMLRDVVAKTGDKWVADEMYIQVGGRMMYHWNVMDAETRYLLASHLSTRRNLPAAIEVFRKALARADHPPKRIVTDKHPSYFKAIRYVVPEAKHVLSKGAEHPFQNNNLSERMQGTFRSREKTLRGMDSLESAQRYLDGYVISYNHFRMHSGIEAETPAEAAKIDVPYKEWADIVRANVVVPPEARTVSRTRIKTVGLPRDITARKRLQRRKRRAMRRAEIQANKKTARQAASDGMKPMWTKDLKQTRASKMSKREIEKLRKEGKLRQSEKGRRPKAVLPDVKDVSELRMNLDSSPAEKGSGQMHRKKVYRRKISSPQPEMPLGKSKPKVAGGSMEERMGIHQNTPRGLRPKPAGSNRRRHSSPARQPRLL